MWAKLVLLINELVEVIPEKTSIHIHDLQKKVDNTFTTWLSRRFAGLVNLPPVPPVMLHHIPRFIARQIIEDFKAKVALLMVDGLSLDQWQVVQETLTTQQFNFRFCEQEVFAWIPSLTSVSRQAAFAGKPPIYFPNSIQVTDKEPVVWTQFWADQGLTSTEVVYAKGLGDSNLMNLSEALLHPKVRVAGLVIDKVDKIMHGMELGSAGMHNQVRQWAQQPYLNTLLDLLLNRGFNVYLTSDHGNIEAEGCGHPSEGVIADLRGERARIYSDSALRSRVKKHFPDAIEWKQIGLPVDYYTLIAPHRKAFIQEGKHVVSHGGISVEELIVPFIKFERRKISTYNRNHMIGIDRLIRLEWLELTVNLLLAGNKEKEIEAILNETLAPSFTAASPNTLRGSLSKTMTILMKTWIRVPLDLIHLRNKGINLIGKTFTDSNLPMHWGMISVVYPFWSNVATQVGRLLKLQGNVAVSQIQRRMQEQYGQKETVARRTRYLLRTFIDWQVLKDNDIRGVYSLGKQISIDRIEIISWLIEAFLYTRPHNSIILNELLNSPSLFPFRLKPFTAENILSMSPNLEILSHGLHDDLIILRNRT